MQLTTDLKKYILFATLLVLCSCFPSKKPKIVIKNNTNDTFDSIKVFTSINLPTVFYSVEPNQTIRGEILFDEGLQKDGCYKLSIYNKGDLLRKECFGYYTNGSSLNHKFIIAIENDTINIESK